MSQLFTDATIQALWNFIRVEDIDFVSHHQFGRDIWNDLGRVSAPSVCVSNQLFTDATIQVLWNFIRVEDIDFVTSLGGYLEQFVSGFRSQRLSTLEAVENESKCLPIFDQICGHTFEQLLTLVNLKREA